MIRGYSDPQDVEDDTIKSTRNKTCSSSNSNNNVNKNENDVENEDDHVNENGDDDNGLSRIIKEYASNIQYLWCPPPEITNVLSHNDDQPPHIQQEQQIYRRRRPIPVLKNPPTSFEFYKHYVSLNRPCIIQNTICVNNNNINTKMLVPYCLSVDDILQLLSPEQQENQATRMITVDVTPDGYGDCIRLGQQQQQQPSEEQQLQQQPYFVRPCKSK